MVNAESQIPSKGPLSSLSENDWTQVSEYLPYGGTRHLRKAYRIPLAHLHYNIENGRYRTKYLLLKKANPGLNIDACEERWSTEIFKMLSGTWEDNVFGVSTRAERPYFEALKEDIRNRGQERPGIVLETGGVMSGNRRLAALRDLYEEAREARFGVFEAFIVPGGGAVSPSDRWRLEMSAQVGQARLTKDYSPIEKLLKLEEGVQLFLGDAAETTEESAIRAVANDFGRDPDEVKADLESLRYIKEYLEAIGHAEEWWKAEGLTEVFTEVEPALQAAVRQGLRSAERGALKRRIFQVINNEQADYRLIRMIRTAIGSGRRTRQIRSAVNILLEDAPDSGQLRKQPTSTSKTHVGQVVGSFEAEVQARRDEQRPLNLADRAVKNLRALDDVICRGVMDDGQTVQLTEKVREARDLADQCLSRLKE